MNVAIGDTVVGHDLEIAALKVRCPHCRARPGKVCITPSGDQFGGWMTLKLHRKRLLAAAEVTQ